MTLLFNVYLTDVPANKLTPWGGDRGNLPQRSKLDITKYTLASLSAVYPYTKAIINIELDPNRYSLEDNKLLEDFIKNEFKDTEVLFSSKRITLQHEWQEIYNHINSDFIFYLGNHDHVFIDSDNSYLKELLKTAKTQYGKYTTISTSHFPENIRWAKSGYINPGESIPKNPHQGYKLEDTHLYHKGINIDSLNIITKELYHNWFFTGTWGDVKVYRSDGVISLGGASVMNMRNTELPQQDIIIPLKEQFRHFDGYMHQYINNNICPSIDIPKGFFESEIKIRYGYDNYKEGWVNINPKNPNYYAFDRTGTDYKITLDDIPLFWKDRIIEIDSNKDINEEEMIQYKLQSILQMIYSDSRYNPYIDKEVEQKVLSTYLKTHKQYNLI